MKDGLLWASSILPTIAEAELLAKASGMNVGLKR
jgi:hypothetical protein